MAVDGHTKNFQGLASFYNICFFLTNFFLKIQDKILHLEIQLIFFHPLGVALKNRSKVKKNWSESEKTTTLKLESRKFEMGYKWNCLTNN